MKSRLLMAPVLFSLLFLPATAFASQKQEVYVTGTVESFGGYIFSNKVEFTLTKPGVTQIGTVVVDGMYNGEYPWIMRIYTDNIRFKGVAGLGQHPIPLGLLSKDGRFSLPVQISSSNFGTDTWRTIPDINQPDYHPYQPTSIHGTADYTDCVFMGIDPRNAVWVSGHDGVLFTDDDNLLGDVTIKTPFEMGLRVDAPERTVEGEYEGFLYIEIVPAP